MGGDIDDNYTISYFDESEIFGSKLNALISAIVRLQACKNTAIELLKIEIPIDISY